jgi:hypothetical protein
LCECIGGSGARRLRLEQGGQAGARFLRGGVDRDRVTVGGECTCGFAEVLAQRATETNEATDGALGRTTRRTFEDVCHLTPAAGLGQQVRERADALLVILVVGDDALPGSDRGVEILALLVMDLCDPDEVGPLLVRGR